ncbi:MAG: methyl-accepting chemotaxis protein [Alphaproteobacteria bacterium]|nr:methyl-accepting chemotaxis protein [Alphaproteobacteria bacterium]
MAKKAKEVEVIDMLGAKTVAKKTSVITHAKRVFLIVSVIWLAFVIWFPLHVKARYSSPIKKSIVVSMFFDLQRNIVEQYEKLLAGIKKSINLEKPIGVAIEKVKIVESKVDKVTDTTAKAKDTTAKAKNTTASVKGLTGLVNKFGVKTNAVDNVVAQADKGIDKANAAVAKVDDTAKMVNERLEKVEKELTKVAQTEVDKMIDEAVKHQLDKNSGGLGTTLLTNYGIKHVYPWRPSSWPVAVRIYNDLEKSNVGVVQILTRTVNKYFGYVAWGLVIAAWAAGLYVWLMIRKKYKAVVAPFIVCPRCGHTFADKRTAVSLLKVLQPWTWF